MDSLLLGIPLSKSCRSSVDSAAKADTGNIVINIMTDSSKLSSRLVILFILILSFHKNRPPVLLSGIKKEPVKAPCDMGS